MEQNLNKGMKFNNRVMSVIFTVAFIALYYVTLGYPAKAAAYPKLLLICGIVFSVGLFAATFTSKTEKKKTTIPRKELITLLISIGLMALYAIIIPIIGYSVSTFIYMVAQMWVINKNSKKLTLVLTALITTVILYVAFGMLLNVWLPKGILI